MGVGKAGLDTVYQVRRLASHFQGPLWSLGWQAGALPFWRRKGREDGGRSRKLGRGRVDLLGKLRQELGLEVSGRSVARKCERSLVECRVRKQDGEEDP